MLFVGRVVAAVVASVVVVSVVVVVVGAGSVAAAVVLVVSANSVTVSIVVVGKSTGNSTGISCACTWISRQSRHIKFNFNWNDIVSEYNCSCCRVLLAFQTDRRDEHLVLRPLRKPY